MLIEGKDKCFDGRGVVLHAGGSVVCRGLSMKSITRRTIRIFYILAHMARFSCPTSSDRHYWSFYPTLSMNLLSMDLFLGIDDLWR